MLALGLSLAVGCILVLLLPCCLTADTVWMKNCLGATAAKYEVISVGSLALADDFLHNVILVLFCSFSKKHPLHTFYVRGVILKIFFVKKA